MSTLVLHAWDVPAGYAGRRLEAAVERVPHALVEALHGARKAYAEAADHGHGAHASDALRHLLACEESIWRAVAAEYCAATPEWTEYTADRLANSDAAIWTEEVEP